MSTWQVNATLARLEQAMDDLDANHAGQILSELTLAGNAPKALMQVTRDIVRNLRSREKLQAESAKLG